MKKTIKLIAAVAGFAAASVAAQADDLVNTLVKKGYLTSAEAAELSSSSNGNDVAVSAGENVKKLKFNGRAAFQFNNLSTDVKDATNPSDTGYFYARMIRLGTKATLADNFYGIVNMELSDAGSEGSESEFRLERAFIGYTGFQNTKVKIGYGKIPFGYEFTTGFQKLKGIERSVANNYFISSNTNAGGRYSGIQASGKVMNTGVKYALALTNARSGDDDDNDGTANDLKYTARLQYAPKLEDKGDLLIGADATTSNWDASDSINEVTAYNIYADYAFKAFSITASYFIAEVENGISAGTDAEPTGYAIEAAYDIDKNWQPVIRYSAVDADGQFNANIGNLIRKAPSAGIAGGNYDEVSSWFFGVNYHFLGNDAKLSVGYHMAEFEKQAANSTAKADVNGFRIQALLNF